MNPRPNDLPGPTRLLQHPAAPSNSYSLGPHETDPYETDSHEPDPYETREVAA